jgi:tetratricopeptide (TPR) repeat protein
LTTALKDCGPKTWRPKVRRSWRLILAGIVVASALAAVFAASHHYAPPSPQEKYRAAIAALDRRDWKLVRGYVRELKSSQGTSAESHFLRGAMLLEKGFWHPAIDELDQARQKPDLAIESLTLIGQAWYRLGRHIEAQAALKLVLKQEPDNVDAHRWLAASYYDLGAVGDALLHLQRTADLDPVDPRPLRLLGLIHKDFGQYEAAIPYYEESLRRKSDQADVVEIRVELASCQVETRRYNDALKTLEQCPNSAEFNVLRAKCHYAQGRTRLAKAALLVALEQDSDSLDGLLLHGTILLEDGDIAKAIDAFQRAIKTQPKDYTAHFKLAQAYAHAGDDERSKIEQEMAEKIRVIRHEFAQLHKAAWERRGDAAVRLRLATLARELDRPDLADVWLRSAAALQPDVAKDQSDK